MIEVGETLEYFKKTWEVVKITSYSVEVAEVGDPDPLIISIAYLDFVNLFLFGIQPDKVKVTGASHVHS